MTEKLQKLNVRVPASVIDALREMAKAESKKTGLRVDLSSVVRRALYRDVLAAGKKGGAA